MKKESWGRWKKVDSAPQLTSISTMRHRRGRALPSIRRYPVLSAVDSFAQQDDQLRNYSQSRLVIF